MRPSINSNIALAHSQGRHVLGKKLLTQKLPLTLRRLPNFLGVEVSHAENEPALKERVPVGSHELTKYRTGVLHEENEAGFKQRVPVSTDESTKTKPASFSRGQCVGGSCIRGQVRGQCVGVPACPFFRGQIGELPRVRVRCSFLPPPNPTRLPQSPHAHAQLASRSRV